MLQDYDPSFSRVYFSRPRLFLRHPLLSRSQLFLRHPLLSRSELFLPPSLPDPFLLSSLIRPVARLVVAGRGRQLQRMTDISSCRRKEVDGKRHCSATLYSNGSTSVAVYYGQTPSQRGPIRPPS
ncbi:hypothetical protein TNCV_4588511 [Trichonephila clavipes]|nr:hypothetical protein TNCV_4588511 [Trichonephila clavipes]